MTITADTEITETDTRATRLLALEAQICQACDDLGTARQSADITAAVDAMQDLGVLLQHTVQELADLAHETSLR